MPTTTRRKAATRTEVPHRRPRGTGTIRRRGDTFTALWFTIDPATGKRHQQSKGGFASEAEAQRHLNSVLAQVQAGTFRRDTRLTVKQLFEDHWLPVKDSEGHKPNTIAYYENVIKGVATRIGGLHVTELTPAVVAKMVKGMETAGLSQRSRQAAVGTLKAATAWAARPSVRLIPMDPLAEYRRPSLKSDARAVQAWSIEEARTFLASVADDRFVACWSLLLTRGLRRGELAGLRWAAIDLDAKRLTVKASRVVVNARVIDSSPKVGHGRTVPLDGRLVVLLRALRATQEAEAEIAAEAYQHTGYVMTDGLGRPMHPDSISRRFDNLVSKVGLPRLTVHGLRHTAATAMLASGVPTKVVSEMLGHSSTTITLEIYGHVLPGMAEQAGESLSRALLD